VAVTLMDLGLCFTGDALFTAVKVIAMASNNGLDVRRIFSRNVRDNIFVGEFAADNGLDYRSLTS
jgi:hypothetical protein